MSTATPNSRFVILGASNVARGLASLVHTLRRFERQPVEILAAVGHGRSYGQASTVLGRTLPSILDCGLWASLSHRLERDPAPVPTFALVTDIGNDILFGAEVATILGWVRESLNRLQAVGGRTVVVPPPIESLRDMPEWLFPIVRSVLYPTCRLDHAAGLQKAESLVHGLEMLATERSLPLFHVPGDWMSFDHIHIRLRAYGEAWPTMLSEWGLCRNGHEPERKPLQWLRLRAAGFEQRRLLGINTRTRQPAFRWQDGTTLSMY